jgi:hypothetical protein
MKWAIKPVRSQFRDRRCSGTRGALFLVDIFVSRIWVAKGIDSINRGALMRTCGSLSGYPPPAAEWPRIATFPHGALAMRNRITKLASEQNSGQGASCSQEGAGASGNSLAKTSRSTTLG